MTRRNEDAMVKRPAKSESLASGIQCRNEKAIRSLSLKGPSSPQGYSQEAEHELTSPPKGGGSGTLVKESWECGKFPSNSPRV